MIYQIKNFFHPLGILWYKFLSYIEVLHVLSELSKLLELSELIELPEVFSSMKKCLFRGALRPGDPLIKLLELRFVSSSSETSRSSGTIQTSQSSISSHPAFPDDGRMLGQCLQSQSQAQHSSWMRQGFSLSFVGMELFNILLTWSRAGNCK